MEKDSLHFFCSSLALALLLGPALPHLVAPTRQDSGLAYSEYRAAFALFVGTQPLHNPGHEKLVDDWRGITV